MQLQTIRPAQDESQSECAFVKLNKVQNALLVGITEMRSKLSGLQLHSFYQIVFTFYVLYEDGWAGDEITFYQNDDPVRIDPLQLMAATPTHS